MLGLKVRFGEPVQGVNANTDPALSWWHVPVWLGSRYELRDCTLYARVTSANGQEERQLVWSGAPEPTAQQTLRFGDPPHRIPVAVRSESDTQITASPGRLAPFTLAKAVARITDSQAIFHQTNFCDLQPGDYQLQFSLRCGALHFDSP